MVAVAGFRMGSEESFYCLGAHRATFVAVLVDAFAAEVAVAGLESVAVAVDSEC